mgnify:CR=1 FL=1
MVEAMSKSFLALVPPSMGPYLATITALASLPFTFFVSNDAFYFGVLPVIGEAAATYGITPVEMARASLIGQPVPSFEDLFGRYAARIPTPALNRALQELREARQPPGRGRRRLNLLYGTQISTRPPRIRIYVNDRGLVTRDYGYWVENELRKRFELEGVPVSIDFVKSE